MCGGLGVKGDALYFKFISQTINKHENCSVVGCHYYGDLWKFFAAKLVAFCLLFKVPL